MDIIILFFKNTAIIWIPTVLGIIFWRLLNAYKIQYFVSNKLNHKMIEINIPRDVYKSPQAMELIIEVLHHLGGGAMDWKHRLWSGSVLFPSSLEVVSIEGSIYFFIRADAKLIPVLKSTIYSQYPQAEVHDVDDYTKYVPDYNTHQDSWSVYAADYKLAQENFIPIKTYIDYELDKNVGSLDEEQKIDPLTPMLEFLSTIKAGEQIWIQYIVRASTFNSWRKDAAEFIKEIMGRGKVLDDDEPFQSVKLTYGEQDMVKGIERSLSKLAFECVIRCMYIARKEDENPGRKGYFKSPIFQPFSSEYFNGIRKSNDTDLDWVWEDVTGGRIPATKRRFFNEYVRRDAFYDGFWKYANPLWQKREKPMILTSEELATLFHLPGRVSETSTLERIEATKAEPPTNLPL